jgi:hypothetical protein
MFSKIKDGGVAGKQTGMLRTDTESAARPEGLLRIQSTAVNKLVSGRAKEKLSRNFAKAYAYRIYTSAWVTPLITVAVLEMREKYHLSIAETALAQGVLEFVFKPFTYALFEWAASHIRLGYVEASKEKAAEAGKAMT